MIRLGGPVFGGTNTAANHWDDDPDTWCRAVVDEGYRAAYAPVVEGDADIAEFARAASQADIVIAEVGIWRNLIATDELERRANVAEATRLLAVADRIGARCGVTFAGTRGEGAAGPGEGNFSRDVHALIVDTARQIIDDVRPTRTKLALECMPTTFPDSVDSYEELIRDIDRSGFGVHFDPVNLIVSPRTYAEHRELIRDFVDRLGSRIVSCHAKDIELSAETVSHLSEVAPGEGGLDYAVLLRELSRLADDTPLMLEHLAGPDLYRKAAGFVRGEAARAGVALER